MSSHKLIRERVMLADEVEMTMDVGYINGVVDETEITIDGSFIIDGERKDEFSQALQNIIDEYRC